MKKARLAPHDFHGGLISQEKIHVHLENHLQHDLILQRPPKQCSAWPCYPEFQCRHLGPFRLSTKRSTRVGLPSCCQSWWEADSLLQSVNRWCLWQASETWNWVNWLNWLDAACYVFPFFMSWQDLATNEHRDCSICRRLMAWIVVPYWVDGLQGKDEMMRILGVIGKNRRQ